MLRRAILYSGVGALADNRVAVALLAPGEAGGVLPASLATVQRDVARAKTAFQSCCYDELSRMLPGMLAGATTAVETSLNDESRRDVRKAQTDLLHVATSLLLKQGHVALALVAADRASQTAYASGEPVAELRRASSPIRVSQQDTATSPTSW